MCCLNLKIFDQLDMQSNKSKILQRSSVKKCGSIFSVSYTHLTLPTT